MDYAFNADPTSKRTSNATPKPKPQSKTKSKSTPKSIVPKKPKQSPAVKKTKKTPIKKSTKTPKITPPPKSTEIARKISLPKSTKEKPLPKRTRKPFPVKKQKTKSTNAATPVKIGEPKTPAIKIIPCKPRKQPKPIDPNKVSEPANSTRSAKKRLYAEDAFIQSSDTVGHKKTRTEFFSNLCDCDHDCDCK